MPAPATSTEGLISTFLAVRASCRKTLATAARRSCLAFSVALDSPIACDNVRLYLDRLRWVRPTVRGEFLKSKGVEPGPIYRQILDRLLYARLDGKIRTASEEEVMAKTLLSRLTTETRRTRSSLGTESFPADEAAKSK